MFLIRTRRLSRGASAPVPTGKLGHIGSRAGFEGEPGESIYSASKAAIANISESLQAELEPFEIESMIVEPGVFRTDVLDSSSLQLPRNRIDDYDGTPAHAVLEALDDRNHSQGGDPVKAAALIYEVTSGERLPLHLPVGRDALERRVAMTERLERELEPWREMSLETAYDE